MPETATWGNFFPSGGIPQSAIAPQQQSNPAMDEYLRMMGQAIGASANRPSFLQQAAQFGLLPDGTSPQNYGQRLNPGLKGGAFPTPQSFEASVRQREADQGFRARENAMYAVNATKQNQAMQQAQDAVNPFVTPQPLQGGGQGMMIDPQYGGGVGLGGVSNQQLATSVVPQREQMGFNETNNFIGEMGPFPQAEQMGRDSLFAKERSDAIFGGGMNAGPGAAQDYYLQNVNTYRPDVEQQLAQKLQSNEQDFRKALPGAAQNNAATYQRETEGASALGQGYRRINDKEFLGPDGKIRSRDELFYEGVNPNKPEEGVLVEPGKDVSTSSPVASPTGTPTPPPATPSTGEPVKPQKPAKPDILKTPTERRQEGYEKEVKEQSKSRSLFTGPIGDMWGILKSLPKAKGATASDPFSWFNFLNPLKAGEWGDSGEAQYHKQIIGLMSQTGMSYDDAKRAVARRNPDMIR